MNTYNCVGIDDILPGDYIYTNNMVMMVFAIKIDIYDRVELTLLMPEEITDGQVNAVTVKFDINESVLRVSECRDIEDEEDEENYHE